MLDLEIEVRERLRLRAFEVDGEREPQTQARNVDGEWVQVDAVERILDDLELSLVDRAPRRFEAKSAARRSSSSCSMPSR